LGWWNRKRGKNGTGGVEYLIYLGTLVGFYDITRATEKSIKFMGLVDIIANP
jgi:hypothetical protein